MLTCSIVICSLNRPESLARLLKSLDEQTHPYKPEIILCQEEGNLVEFKDKGWRKATGDIVIWLDDDVVCEPDYIAWIMHSFEMEHIVGATGPTIVDNLSNRDVFRDDWLGKLYRKLFLDNQWLCPGIITKCGASTLGANYDVDHFFQTVDFLEPSAFAMRRWCVEKVGGFDLGFGGVAEWCDVDLSYKIKEYGSLIFLPEAKVYHYPVKGDGVYNKRLNAKSRYDNYVRFADRWVKPSFKHYVYRLFLKTYFTGKEMRLW